jgi:hypothetical protein
MLLKNLPLIILILLLQKPALSQYNPARWQTVDTITYQDPENDEQYLIITAGNTSKLWQIYPCSGVLQVDTNAWNTFIRQRTFYLTIKATDAAGLSTKRVVKAVLTKPRNAVITMQ